MRRDKIIYWTATGLIAAVMTYSVINFNLKSPLGPEVYRTEGPFGHLRLPDYLRVELSIAKALGVILLLLPAIPTGLKGFTYAGFAITLVSAAWAHFSVGDPALFIIDPLIFLCILGLSYFYYRKTYRVGTVEEGRWSAAG